MSGKHRIEALCETLEVSRSGYHAWRNRGPSPRALAAAKLAERMRAAHAASRGTYGSPRIARQLGCLGARHRVARLMRAEGEPQSQLLRQRHHGGLLEHPQKRTGPPHHFVSRDQARLALFDYIEVFYNRVRIHSSLGFNSPLDYESNLN